MTDRWLKVIDQTKCIGCHACTTACKSENEVPLSVTRTYVKSVDVGEFPQPFADMVEKDFPVRKLFDSQYGMPFEQELIILLGKDAFLHANASAVRGLLDDLRASLAFYLERPREARQILMDAKMVRLAPDIYLNMKDYYRDPTLRPDAAALERVQDIMIGTSFTKKRADISALVDLSYLPK